MMMIQDSNDKEGFGSGKILSHTSYSLDQIIAPNNLILFPKLKEL